MISTLHLTYRGLSLEVSADSEADLIWLHDFLGPSYRRMDGAGQALRHRVGIHGDPDWEGLRREWAQQEANGQLQSVLAHVLDGSDLHLPCVRRQEGALLAWEGLWECFYRRDPADVTTVLRPAGPHPPLRPRLALMRAVRELALHHELRSGALALHASGLVREGRAVLFAGPRRAGKTTRLSACLSLVPDLQLLANDRVMVSPHPGGWNCRGMATVVSVRTGDEDLLPGLRQRLHAHTLGPETGPGEPRTREFPPNGRLMLSPSQFCRSLGVTMAPESQPAAIFLPRIDPTVRGLHWRRIDASAAAGTLAEALFGAAHPHSQSQLFDTPESGPFPGPAERLALVRRLAREVPCGELVVGQDAYRPECLKELLEGALLAT